MPNPSPDKPIEDEMELTRPIIGIENRTAREVFDIMCDRIRASQPAGAHIVPMGLAELAWSWVCYRLVLAWPYRFFMSRPHAAILPWAGNFAYRCGANNNAFEKALQAREDIDAALSNNPGGSGG